MADIPKKGAEVSQVIATVPNIKNFEELKLLHLKELYEPLPLNNEPLSSGRKLIKSYSLKEVIDDAGYLPITEDDFCDNERNQNNIENSHVINLKPESKEFYISSPAENTKTDRPRAESEVYITKEE